MAPSCVPASIFESPRRPLALGDLEALMRRRRVLGLAEMMNFPGVIAGDAGELAKLELEGAQHVDGHAPGVARPVAPGVRRRRHPLRPRGAHRRGGRERLRAGMWLLIREASMARNLHALLPLVSEYGPGRIAFCTDDRDPGRHRRQRACERDGARRGRRRDRPCGRAPDGEPPSRPVARPAQPRRGRARLRRRPAPAARSRAVRPGRRAQARAADRARSRAREVPEWVRQTVRIKPVGVDDLAIPGEGGSVRAIGLVEEQVVTESLVREPLVVDGHVVSDPERDLAEARRRRAAPRHRADRPRPALGLGARARRARLDRRARCAQPRRRRRERRGHGLRDRAAGGDRRRDRHRADGQVLAECPLPVAGLLSDQPLDVVVEQSRATNEAAQGLGWRGATPFLTLAFLALSVIPSLKLTDKGLVDVDRFELVPIAAGEPTGLPRSQSSLTSGPSASRSLLRAGCRS